MGEGTGMAVLEANSTTDIYSWAYNWASMCDISVKPMLTDHEARLIVKGKSNPKVFLMQNFVNSMAATLDADKYCTDKAMFNPPGAPPMPIKTMVGMMKAIKAAFPQWRSLMLGYTENKDGTATVLTQQVLGPMKHDLPAMGPFPPVRLRDAPRHAKETNWVFPVEVGTYTFDRSGTKVHSGAYAGLVADEENNPAATHHGERVTPWVTDNWNKKGDMSDVGFGILFQMMGVDLSDLRKRGQI